MQIPVYQKLAPKVKELRLLGMSQHDIALALHVDDKTIRNAIAFYKNDQNVLF